MKKLILAILLLLLPLSAMAANTIDAETYSVTITAIDSTWHYRTSYLDAKYADGIKVEYIIFSPGATDDICLIRDDASDGAILFRAKCADVYDQRIIYFAGQLIKPYLDVTEGAPNASAILTIKISHRQKND